MKTLEPLHKDIGHLKAAAARHGAENVFMNSASPGVVALFQPNQHFGEQQVLVAEAKRRFFSTDLSSEGELAVCVAQPRNVGELSRAVAQAAVGPSIAQPTRPGVCRRRAKQE